jgi:hypothetical protein
MQANLAIEVTELLSKTLENAMKDMLVQAITYCGERYNFDSTEAIRDLGLERVKFVKKPMAKRTATTTTKPKKNTLPFPLPFIKSFVDLQGCQALNYNQGLFTQCKKNKMDGGRFCKKCQTEADKNACGEPNCGTIQQRLEADLMEFQDSKGRKPIPYVKIMKKHNLTREQVEEFVGSQIDDIHFAEPIAKKNKKNNKVIEADGVEDLFEKLVGEQEQEQEQEQEDEEEEEQQPVQDKKAEEKKAKEAEKEQKRLQKEAEKEQKRLQKEAEKEQKRLQREAEKAEREAKKAQERETKKITKKTTTKQEETKQEDDEQEEQAKKVTVTRITIDGKKYLKTNSNILYNPETKEEVGLYDPITKTIQELPEDSDDEEEDEEEEYDD